MVDKAKPSVYEEAIRITSVYLGPAANRFLNRQIESHLRKAPQKLTRADLANLIDWIRVTVALLTDKGEIVEEYVAELQKLARSAPKRNQK